MLIKNIKKNLLRKRKTKNVKIALSEFWYLKSANVYMKNILFVKKPKGYWNDSTNIRQFLEVLKNKLNLKTPNDWKLITQKQILSFGGSRLLSKYSVHEIKLLGCPGNNEIISEKQNKPAGYWNNKENIIKFFNELKDKYNIKTQEDWNLITRKIVTKHGGSYLFRKYSLQKLKEIICSKISINNNNLKQFCEKIKIIYNLKTPNDWKSVNKQMIILNGGKSLLARYSLLDIKLMGCPDGFRKNKPSGYWEDKNNILQFLDEFKLNFHLKTPNDWNLITKKQIISFGGARLLSKYTLFDLKLLGCPEGKNLFVKPNQPKSFGYWEDKNNILQFLDELKINLNLKTPNDWNAITRKEIICNGGSSLLSKYSMFDLKVLGCPEGKLLFNASNKSIRYWGDVKNVSQFLENVKIKLNLKTPNDWNLITQKQIISFGGGSLLNSYSLFELKCIGCPEGKLLYNTPNLSKPSGYWKNKENIINFIEKLKENFHLHTINDWNRLSRSQIRSFGGHSLDKISIENIIRLKNPKYNFDNIKNSKKSAQRWLFLQVQKLFPNEEIIEDYFHSDISRESGYCVQFDIFLIYKNIAIEYHGKHHYEDIPKTFAPLELYKNRDDEKIRLCNKFGIKLVVIPYWWDNKFDSLRITLESLFTKLSR